MAVYTSTISVGFKKSSTLCLSSYFQLCPVIISEPITISDDPCLSSSLALPYTCERRFKFYILGGLKRTEKKKSLSHNFQDFNTIADEIISKFYICNL